MGHTLHMIGGEVVRGHKQRNVPSRLLVQGPASGRSRPDKKVTLEGSLSGMEKAVVLAAPFSCGIKEERKRGGTPPCARGIPWRSQNVLGSALSGQEGA